MLLILSLRRTGGEAVSSAVPHVTFLALVAVSRSWQGCGLTLLLCVQHRNRSRALCWHGLSRVCTQEQRGSVWTQDSSRVLSPLQDVARGRWGQPLCSCDTSGSRHCRIGLQVLSPAGVKCLQLPGAGEDALANSLWGAGVVLCSQRCYSGVGFLISVLLLVHCTSPEQQQSRSLLLHVEAFLPFSAGSRKSQLISVVIPGWFRNLRPFFRVERAAKVLLWTGTHLDSPG